MDYISLDIVTYVNYSPGNLMHFQLIIHSPADQMCKRADRGTCRVVGDSVNELVRGLLKGVS